MNKSQALQIVGGLSKPSKMPSYSIGLPAKECGTGSKLAQLDGSVCSGCYALKGQYRFSNVQAVQYRRLAALDNPEWVDAMVTLLENEEFFRWHDSGDIRDLTHMEKIMEVVRRTPHCNHWIPTKEKRIVKQWLRAGNVIPGNCVVRLSAPMIDMRIRNHGDAIAGLKFSAVHTKSPQGRACIAYQQNGECRDCRACWNRRIDCISYPKH